jgi:hypothetical protein
MIIIANMNKAVALVEFMQDHPLSESLASIQWLIIAAGGARKTHDQLKMGG